MAIALCLNEDNRIHSAWTVLPNGKYDGMPIVETIPDGNITDYQYINNEFIYDPIPVVEPIEIPSRLDILEAKLYYTQMMTDTLLEE